MKMNKKAQAGPIVGMAIGVVLLVVVIGTVFTFLTDNSLGLQIANETVVTTLEENTQLGHTEITNDTLIVYNGTTDLLVITDGNYTFYNELGLINISNLTGTWFPTTTTPTMRYYYEYTPTGYIDSSMNRTLIAIIPILLAIAALIFILAFANK